MEEFDFAKVEKKWQKKWEDAKVFEVSEDSKKEKYYVLEMFPYPSGSGLHMGHAWNYTIGDILARFKIMRGFNVLHPMGYDSLGLPAENAAIEAGTHPEDYNKKSIANYIKQQKELGLSYDWSRILSTDNPDYYKWDQWIFLKMFGKGLAYQKTSAVNWCPKCNTVLANEQVHEGKCWRHEDTKVEIRQLKQWFLKTTEYADELYEGIDKLNWPEKTKAMQKNWIGKSHGTEIGFEINEETWPIFTTRPDTIHGVTFLVVSAQHEKLMDLVTKEQKPAVEKFLNKLKSVSEKELADMEKEGVFIGCYAINPINGKEIPVYAGNFVVADYGSGMVMAVPAHDQRDFEFAKKYGIEIKQVITTKDPLDFKNKYTGEKAFTVYGTLIGSKQFSGMESEIAKEEITKYLEEKGKGRKVTNFKLRDWGISRQRYWGTPIPIIHCDKCGAIPVPEKELPVQLPKNVKFGKGNPLETNEDWIKVKCPKCGKPARRETDTMDTFANSSWYFLRFTDPQNNEEIFDKKKAKYWCPVDTYIGGAEHACMHLIYSRFYTRFLRDLGLIQFDEPAKKLFHQGMLSGEGGVKMSKSKPETVVLPEEISKKYGIDTARFFLSSLASPDKNIDWNESGINGSFRFTKRIISYFERLENKKDSKEMLILLNKTIKNVTENYENFEYRKATIELRGLFDKIEKEQVSKETLEKFLKLLCPLCPHIAEELWKKLGHKDFISTSDWPTYDEKKLKVEKKEENLGEKISERVKEILEKISGEKVFVYVMPFEIGKIDEKEVSEAVGKEVRIFATNDMKKYDPQNKAKNARPGMASVYVE